MGPPCLEGELGWMNSQGFLSVWVGGLYCRWGSQLLSPQEATECLESCSQPSQGRSLGIKPLLPTKAEGL